MKNLLIVSALLMSVIALSGCSNTLDGAGRDIEKAGQKIQKTF